MPVFHAHVPAGQLTGSEKRGLADGLNLALYEALGTPMEDRFIVISEHGEDELFLHPNFPDLQRSARAVVITVTLGAGRTVEKKRRLAELVTRYACSDGADRPARSIRPACLMSPYSGSVGN